MNQWHVYDDKNLKLYMLYANYDVSSSKQYLVFSLHVSRSGLCAASIGGYINPNGSEKDYISTVRLIRDMKQLMITTIFEKGVEESND
jgi:hypothetical protein